MIDKIGKNYLGQEGFNLRFNLGMTQLGINYCILKNENHPRGTLAILHCFEVILKRIFF